MGDAADTISDSENIALADTIIGGAGNDTLAFGTDNAVAVVAGNLAATSGFDVISMGNQADNAIAVELTDAVVGACDSDTITVNGHTTDTITLTAAVNANNTVILGDNGANFTLAGDTRATIGVIDAAGDGAANDATTTVPLVLAVRS